MYPDSMFDPILDLSLSSNAYQAKHRTTSSVYIQPIKLKNSQKSYSLKNSTLYMFEASLLEQWVKYERGSEPHQNFVPPNKFTLGIMTKKGTDEYIVVESHLHTCENMIMAYKAGIKACGNEFNVVSDQCHIDFVERQ